SRTYFLAFCIISKGGTTSPVCLLNTSHKLYEDWFKGWLTKTEYKVLVQPSVSYTCLMKFPASVKSPSTISCGCFLLRQTIIAAMPLSTNGFPVHASKLT